MNHANAQMMEQRQRGAILGAGTRIASAEPPSSEIAEQRKRLDAAINILGDSLRELRGRLEPVMKPVAPEPATDSVGMAQQGPSSDHGIFLANARMQIDSLTDGVQDLLRRLAV